MPLSLFYLTTAINVLLVFGLCFESQARRDLGHHLHFSQRKLNIINRNTRKAPPSRLLFRNYVDQDGRWPIQARFWLEWGSSHVIDLENFGFPHPWLRVVCGVRTKQHSARLFEDPKEMYRISGKPGQCRFKLYVLFHQTFFRFGYAGVPDIGRALAGGRDSRQRTCPLKLARSLAPQSLLPLAAATPCAARNQAMLPQSAM